MVLTSFLNPWSFGGCGAPVPWNVARVQPIGAGPPYAANALATSKSTPSGISAKTLTPYNWAPVTGVMGLESGTGSPAVVLRGPASDWQPLSECQ